MGEGEERGELGRVLGPAANLPVHPFRGRCRIGRTDVNDLGSRSGPTARCCRDCDPSWDCWRVALGRREAVVEM
jgi:hypothetical protein